MNVYVGYSVFGSNQILIHLVFELSLVGSAVVGAEAVHSILILSFLQIVGSVILDEKTGQSILTRF